MYENKKYPPSSKEAAKKVKITLFQRPPSKRRELLYYLEPFSYGLPIAFGASAFPTNPANANIVST